MSAEPQCPLGNCPAGHLLEAQGLGAELNISSEAVPRANLVLDWHHSPIGEEFHGIRPPCQPEALGPQRDAAKNQSSAFTAMLAAVDPSMTPMAPSGMHVVGPDTVDVNKCALPRAVLVMFQGR
jgi:hypothetical protein